MQLRHGGQCSPSSIPASSEFGGHSSHSIAAGRKRRRRSFVVRVAVVDTDSWDWEGIPAVEDSLAAAGSGAGSCRADKVLELALAIEERRGRRHTGRPELQLDIDQILAVSLRQAPPKWAASGPASWARSPEIVDSTGCC